MLILGDSLDGRPLTERRVTFRSTTELTQMYSGGCVKHKCRCVPDTAGPPRETSSRVPSGLSQLVLAHTNMASSQIVKGRCSCSPTKGFQWNCSRATLVVQWPMANCHMLQLRWSQDTSESKLTTGECLLRLSMSAAASGWKSSLPRPRQKEVSLPTGFSVSW